MTVRIEHPRHDCSAAKFKHLGITGYANIFPYCYNLISLNEDSYIFENFLFFVHS